MPSWESLESITGFTVAVSPDLSAQYYQFILEVSPFLLWQSPRFHSGGLPVSILAVSPIPFRRTPRPPPGSLTAFILVISPGSLV